MDTTMEWLRNVNAQLDRSGVEYEELAHAFRRLYELHQEMLAQSRRQTREIDRHGVLAQNEIDQLESVLRQVAQIVKEFA